MVISSKPVTAEATDLFHGFNFSLSRILLPFPPSTRVILKTFLINYLHIESNFKVDSPRTWLYTGAHPGSAIKGNSERGQRKANWDALHSTGHPSYPLALTNVMLTSGFQHFSVTSATWRFQPKIILLFMQWFNKPLLGQILLRFPRDWKHHGLKEIQGIQWDLFHDSSLEMLWLMFCLVICMWYESHRSC